jgi:hypothetical protein
VKSLNVGWTWPQDTLVKKLCNQSIMALFVCLSRLFTLCLHNPERLHGLTNPILNEQAYVILFSTKVIRILFNDAFSLYYIASFVDKWMGMGRWCNQAGGRKHNYPEKNLCPRRFFHQKSHVDWPGIEPGFPRWEAWDVAAKWKSATHLFLMLRERFRCMESILWPAIRLFLYDRRPWWFVVKFCKCFRLFL